MSRVILDNLYMPVDYHHLGVRLHAFHSIICGLAPMPDLMVIEGFDFDALWKGSLHFLHSLASTMQLFAFSPMLLFLKLVPSAPYFYSSVSDSSSEHAII